MRDDDNSDACDEAPRAEDKCYTKGRLRDEFRMKPAPGVEPVRMYKSPYGGKYGVWRVPMRAKRPQTEKQRQASARLGLQARMKSERGRFAMLAHTWLTLDPVFLDTETYLSHLLCCWFRDFSKNFFIRFPTDCRETLFVLAVLRLV